MNVDENGNEITELNVDDLFQDPEQDDDAQPVKPISPPDIITKGVSQRINEVRAKTEQETLDRIAREDGFENYAAKKAAREKKVLEDSGFDPKDVQSVVEKLLKERLADDPRLKRLEEYESREKNNFVKRELDAINSATGNKFTSIEQLPPETLEVWEKTGNLEQAYWATQGKVIATKGIEAARAGNTKHMGNPGSAKGAKIRGLSEEEKDIYRSIIHGITDEELAKKTVEI